MNFSAPFYFAYWLLLLSLPQKIPSLLSDSRREPKSHSRRVLHMGLFMALRRVTLHRAGIRPHLFLGGDRELVRFSGLIACVLIFACFQPVTILTGIALWMVALFFFRRMAKADPRMRYVYMRQLLYRRYYPARSTPYRENRRFNISAFAKKAK